MDCLDTGNEMSPQEAAEIVTCEVHVSAVGTLEEGESPLKALAANATATRSRRTSRRPNLDAFVMYN